MIKMKLAIFMRTDLGMSKGKIAVQAGHASVLAYHYGYEPKVEKWLIGGEQKKIALKVSSEEALKNIESLAIIKGIQTCRVIDFGLTQVAPNTWTCLAIGPDDDEKIDEITKGYSLL